MSNEPKEHTTPQVDELDKIVKQLLSHLAPLNPNSYPDEASYNDDAGDYEFALDEARELIQSHTNKARIEAQKTEASLWDWHLKQCDIVEASQKFIEERYENLVTLTQSQNKETNEQNT